MAELILAGIGLKNFKAIREADLDLAPLTVLVGENSAGKSSVLQSLLLLAQLASGNSKPGTLGLNGQWLSLGTYADVHNESAPGKPILITVRLRDARTAVDPSGGESRSTRFRIELSGAADTIGVAQISRLELSRSKAVLRLGIDPNPDHEESTATAQGFEGTEGVPPSFRHGSGSGSRLIDSTGEPTRYIGSLEQSGKTVEILATTLVSGFPTEIYALGSDSLDLAKEWLNIIIDARLESGNWDSGSFFLSPQQAVEDLFPHFLAWVEARDREGRTPWPPDALLPPDLERRYRDDIMIRYVSQGSDPPDPDADSLAVGLAGLLQRTNRGPKLIPYYDPVLYSSERLQSYLATSLHYLGPLRADPSPNYQAGRIGITATLGVKGEFTVAALNMYWNQEILAPMPELPDQRMPLGEAVNAWASHLGISQGLRTVARGRLGIELQVADAQTGGVRDLTSVGVGISQLLPVVVLCLIAQPGELIMLEQPELHLHPALQLRLGDFLHAMAASGRQVLVETHSEYIIARLRRRVVEDETGATAERVRIYFASRAGGDSDFKPLAVNRYGSVDDWPEGFFDQGPREAEAILRAAIRKRQGQSIRDPASRGDASTP